MSFLSLCLRTVCISSTKTHPRSSCSLSRLNFKVRCCSVWPELRWKLKKATGVRAEECNVDPPPVFQQGKTNQTTTDANEGRPTERRKNIVFLIFIRGIGYSSPESSSSDIMCAAGQTQCQTDDCDSLKTQISSSNHKYSLFISSYCNITNTLQVIHQCIVALQ